jgi:hypothetical protein
MNEYVRVRARLYDGVLSRALIVILLCILDVNDGDRREDVQDRESIDHLVPATILIDCH